MIAVAVKIDPETKKRLKKLADIKRRSSHWVMREAIDQYVDREEKKESFRQDAMESFEAYQETGLHLTSSEVKNWLGTWGTSSEQDAPKCHR